MYEEPGIGLATVQIGILKRLVVIDISKDKEKDPLFLINPELTFKSKNTSIFEGYFIFTWSFCRNRKACRMSFKLYRLFRKEKI